jgi:lipopolysaccharide export system permease protein
MYGLRNLQVVQITALIHKNYRVYLCAILIKKLDILILKSFIGPFVVTFFVSLFVLVMQFFWLYMDELLGKGFGVWTILKLLFYMSSTMVPMALPLGILLASIMTFGNMGEAYELVAIKSSGISLLRFMRPLFVFISIIGIGAFFFNNNVIPVANLKAFSLLYDLRNARLTLNIRPGQFNHDIPGYAIKIGEQDKDEKTIRNIIIYDGSTYNGNDCIILAQDGEMVPSANGKYIIFRLRNGWRYQEGADNARAGSGPHATQTRMHFERYDKIIDLSALKLNRTNEDLFKNGYQMMNVAQLRADMAGINKSREHDLAMGEANFVNYLPIYNKNPVGDTFRKKLDTNKSRSKPLAMNGSFISRIPDSLKLRAIDAAQSNVRNAVQLIGYTASNIRMQDDNLVKRRIALHSKYTLSFACVLLFLIGAPLGAIIRKGGLGLPIVVAIAFFVVYFIISKVGERMTESGVLPAFAGMWMSTAMLLPIAFIIIRQARNDSPVFTKEWYIRMWRRIREPFRRNLKTA